MHTAIQDPSAAMDWQQAPVEDLIGFVMNRFHAAHREQLPELTRLARRVELVHAGKPGCPAGLADVVEELHQELESHMTKEERVLFPMLIQGMSSEARTPISIMRYEHGRHLEALQAIDRLTGGLAAPAHACDTWRALYDQMRRFSDDLAQHIQLENDVLFSLDSNVAIGAHHA